jgi:hypothetical protein
MSPSLPIITSRINNGYHEHKYVRIISKWYINHQSAHLAKIKQMATLNEKKTKTKDEVGRGVWSEKPRRRSLRHHLPAPVLGDGVRSESELVVARR